MHQHAQRGHRDSAKRHSSQEQCQPCLRRIKIPIRRCASIVGMNRNPWWTRSGNGPRTTSAILLALTLSACSQSVEQTAAVPGDESLHALMVERIDTLQRRIDILTYDQNRSPGELEQAQRRASDEVADAARELAASVSLLDRAGAALGLSPAEQDQFQALALELRSASVDLALLAADADAELEPALESLQRSCASCHELYRGR